MRPDYKLLQYAPGPIFFASNMARLLKYGPATARADIITKIRP